MKPQTRTPSRWRHIFNTGLGTLAALGALCGGQPQASAQLGGTAPPRPMLQPDLYVSDVSREWTYVEGSYGERLYNYYICVRVVNKGNGPSGESWVRTQPANGYSTTTRVPALGVGQVFVAKTIQTGAPWAGRAVTAEADFYKWVTEMSEVNNGGTWFVAGDTPTSPPAGAQADLYVRDVAQYPVIDYSAGFPILVGNLIAVQIKNIGAARSPACWAWVGDRNGYGSTLQAPAIPSLAPGETAWIGYSNATGRRATRVDVGIDPWGAVSESNEVNNNEFWMFLP